MSHDAGSGSDRLGRIDRQRLDDLEAKEAQGVLSTEEKIQLRNLRSIYQQVLGLGLSHPNLSDFVSSEKGAQNPNFVEELANRITDVENQFGKGVWPHKPLSVVIVDGRKIIIDGHHRYEAAKRVGFQGFIPYTKISVKDSGYTIEQLRDFLK